MKITMISLPQLKRPEKNVRIHPDKQIQEMIRSIRMFGQTRPLVCDENFVVLAGNGLLTALETMGAQEAECYVIPNLSDNEKKKLMLADNRIYKLGIDDTAAFDEIIAELGKDIDVPGFDEDLLRMLNTTMADADDMFAGYGIITGNQKAQLDQAAQEYRREEEQFVQQSQPYAQDGANAPLQQPSNAHYEPPQMESGQGMPPAETPVERPAEQQLARKYIVCPKCGERIWV